MPMAATITTNPTSERISMILRPKRSANRPKTGDSKPDIAGVTAARAPAHRAIFAGSVTPSSRT